MGELFETWHGVTLEGGKHGRDHASRKAFEFGIPVSGDRDASVALATAISVTGD